MALKSFEEMRQIDVSNFTEKRDGLDYLNWAKCIDLLHNHGAEKVYFTPIRNENGSSLFKTDEKFKDAKGNTNSCYEVGVHIVIDDIEFDFFGPLMNGSNPVKDNSISQQRIWNCQTRMFVKGVAIRTGLGFALWSSNELVESSNNDDLDKHNIYKIKERVQGLYTQVHKKLTIQEIADALNMTKDQVTAEFAKYDDLNKFEESLRGLLK